MFDALGPPMSDRPALTLVAVAAVVTLAYAGFQLVVDGRVELLETAVFAVVFAAVLAGTSLLRERLAG